MHPKICQIKKPKSNPKIQNYVGLNFETTKTFKEYLRDVFQNITFFISKEILFLFLSLTNAVQSQNPFMKSCPTTVRSAKAHDVSHVITSIRIFLHSKQPHLCACKLEVCHVGKELQEQLTALPFLQEKNEASYASFFLWVKYQQPLEKSNKTSTLLYTTDFKGTKQKHVSFAQGKVFYSKFSMQYYCRGRQVLKKSPHGRSREKENQNILASPSAIYLLLEVHMDIKTSTFHQQTKCMLH